MPKFQKNEKTSMYKRKTAFLLLIHTVLQSSLQKNIIKKNE